MKNSFYRLVFFSASFSVMIFLAACGEKEVLPPAIFVSPNSTNISAESGDVIEFVVTATAGDNALNRVVITQKPLGGITSTIKDTIVIGREAEFYYVYQVPTRATQYLLTFSIYDAEGYSATIGRSLLVETAAYLTETSGYELYSPWNFGSNDGFNINTLESIQLDAGGDSAFTDLAEADDTNDDVLSHHLQSLSGIKYVRNNSFNYAGATAQSAEDSYTSSSPAQLITNVQVNDILIAEYDTTLHKYAVLKITAIMDDSGVSLDRYIFNVKK